jgi:hypothetical protein
VDQRQAVIPSGSTNFNVVFTATIAQMRAFLLQADKPCKVKTNSSGSPVQTFLLGQSTITITGGPTGGTFTVTVAVNGGTPQTTAAIAYNAAASAVQSAIQALSNVGTGNATVTGSAGGPYTVVFATTLGTGALTADGTALTGGSTPAAVGVNYGLSMQWDLQGGLANPVTTSITTLYVDNNAGSDLTLTIVSGIDSTPSTP